MPYRIGLDVGTASCGLVVWRLDKDGQPFELAYNSLNIWPEPLLPSKSGGVNEPKKAARRAARLMRRGHCRRARRLRRIAHLSSMLGLQLPKAGPQDPKRRTQEESRKGREIYRLRAQAAETRIELEDLLRVLLHLAKHRGPSGDWVYAEPGERKTKGQTIGSSNKKAAESAVSEVQEQADRKVAQEKKDIVGGVRKLRDLMSEAAQALDKANLTLGQYLHYRHERGESVILGKPEIGLYPSRRMVEEEFGHIWNTQSGFHSVLRDSKVRREFSDAIFFQRPLKSPAPMVGRCPLEPTLARAPAAQMAAQAFRIEKQLADLRWGIGRRAQPLSGEQKAVVRKLLNAQGEVSFTSINDAFEKASCSGPLGHGLNMDRSSRENLKGNTTLAAFRRLKLDTEWLALDEKTQIQVINFLADLGSPDVLDRDGWHMNFATARKDAATGRYKRRKFAPALVEFINRMRERPNFGRLSAMGLDGKRMGYSIKALKTLTVLMQEGYDERAAIEQTYPERFKKKPLSRELPLPEETGNTVVDVALRQVYRAVRGAMGEMGEPPAQVIVELSRDMALGLKQRREIEIRINLNNKARREAAKAIAEHGQQVTDKKIGRYLLWQQQLHYCPYCDRRIELGEALGSTTEREHILPRTLTRVGGKRSQLVLAHKTCNNEKGNRTPWQAFGPDEVRWRIIEERAAQLKKNKQWGKAKLLLLKDWEGEVLDDKAIRDFTDRQFHESSWIAKLTAQWLRNVCNDVAVSRGQMTAHLRRIWKLDTVIPQVRYAANLPVLDRESKPKPITEEEFQRYKLWWEGHDERAGGVPTNRKPEKRIDHRHHLIDALVISLTGRKLFKKMANHYKVESEKAQRGEYARLRLFEKPPVPALRDLALSIITNAQIRHKQDHHASGPMFEATAYGISRKPDENGNRRLAVSKPLTALLDKDNAAKTRKRLEEIESETTRIIVLKEFDRRIAAGTPLKQIFAPPMLHPQFRTPIRRVRLRLKESVETAAGVIHTNRHGKELRKQYMHDGYAYLEIRVEDGKMTGKPRPVPMQQAMKERALQPIDGLRQFWKNDTVVDHKTGLPYLIRQIKAQGGGMLVLTPATEAREVRDMSSKDGLQSISGAGLVRLAPR